MSPLNEELAKYTELLGLINGMLPLGVKLGTTLVGLVQAGIRQGRGDNKTVEEAQAAVNQFQSATADAKSYIEDWLSTHPPENEDEEGDVNKTTP